MTIHLSFAGACAFSLVGTLTAAGLSSVTKSEHYALLRPQQTCPQISVACPSSFEDGEAITFTADVIGGDHNVVPSYNWTIAVGRIIHGQGTSSIKVNTAGFGRTFTATVSISGFDQGCPATASCSILPGTPAPPAVLFDRYYPKSTGPAVPRKPHARRSVRRRH